MELTVPNILSLAKFSEYITAAKIGNHLALQGGDINEKWARIIYMERMAVQNRYNLNPSDPTLQGTANYLFSLLRYVSDAMTRKNNLAGALPVVTGPANQSVTVGNTATFSVSVTSSTNVTYQWLLNNVVIPGATNSSYVVPNAQLAQSGGLYSIQVTNSTGTVTSNTATLTVTASILLYAYYSDTDPAPNIQAQIDNFSYQFTVAVTHNSPASIPIPQAASNNKYWVFRLVNTENVFNTWSNTQLNSGQIPDSVFQSPAAFNSNTYYYLRNATSFDYTQPLILSTV